MDMTITNNGRVWLATVLFGSFSTTNVDLVTPLTSFAGGPAGTTNKYATPCGLITNKQGNAINRFYYWGNNSASKLSLLHFGNDNSAAYHYFEVGSSTKATEDTDHCLTSPITSGVSISLQANRNDKRGTYFVTVTNTGSSIISIGEIGLFVSIIYDYTTNDFSGISSPMSTSSLFARAAFDSAVDIGAGASKTFDVAITF